MANNVLDYLYEAVEKVPGKIAYSNGVFDMTFREVYDVAGSIATYLDSANVYGEPVVVFMDKHPKTIAAFYGVIMSGNYYVPIDVKMPAARIKLILENVRPRIMICDGNTIDWGDTDYPCEKLLFDNIAYGKVNRERIGEIRSHAIDTDPIYVVFTSGSTGIPKGVVACHRSVIDYIEQLSDVLKFDKNTIFGSQTPLYVDACLKELYPTLKFGATTYLIPGDLFMFPVRLVEFLNTYRINTICWVVSALVMISSVKTFDTVKPEYLRLIAFGSEAFPIKQFNIWKRTLPQTRFVNLYGPTEGTGMCCYYEVNREFGLNDVIPIGKPFRNTDIILLREDGLRAQKGETGEICIRGTSLTMGYYNDPERTSECFVQNPLNSHYPELIYKTGDLGKYNEFGELEFISRKDSQIKHMGYRIELGEIEANVTGIDGVEMAACVYDADAGKIILYYTGNVSKAQLTADLRKRLPGYMMPNVIEKPENMPLTGNGKIDRNRLQKRL